eukprot:SAG22_NODE_7858_length_701_cov_2.146179_1_plen_76_part_00
MRFRSTRPGVDLVFVTTGFPKEVLLEVMDEDYRENGAGPGLLGSGLVELQKPKVSKAPSSSCRSVCCVSAARILA